VVLIELEQVLRRDGRRMLSPLRERMQDLMLAHRMAVVETDDADDAPVSHRAIIA